MSLENFIEKGEIEIKRDPISGLRRLAVLQNNMWWNPVFKQAGLNYMVHYLDEQVNKLTGERFRPYQWHLVADNNTKVDAEFNVIPHPGKAPKEILIGEEVTNQEEIDEYNSKLSIWEQAPTEYFVLREMIRNEGKFYETCYNMTTLRADQDKADK